MSVHIWDLEKDEFIKSFDLKTTSPDNLLFTKNSIFFITYDDRGFYIWDIENEKASLSITEIASAYSILFDDNQDILVSASDGIKKRNLNTSEIIKTVTTDIGKILGITYDSKYLVTYIESLDSIKIRDLKNLDIIHSMKYNSGYRLSYCKNEFYTFKDSTIYLIDVLTDDSNEVYKMDYKIDALTFSQDMNYCSTYEKTGTSTGTGKLWDWITKKIISKIDTGCYISISRNNLYIMTAEGISTNPHYIIRILKTGEKIFDITDFNIVKVRLSNDEKYLIYRNEENYYQFYNIESNKLEKEFKISDEETGWRYYITYDDKYIIETVYNGIRFVNIENQKVEYEYYDYKTWPSDLFMTNNLEYLLVLYDDGTVILYKSPFKTPVPEENNLNKIIIRNYPNPFKDITNIDFELPESCRSILKIYDTFGRELETIQSGYIEAGEHHYKWNARDYPSGVYYYRLQAGKYSKTGVLVLNK